jgi:hypothetical protein
MNHKAACGEAATEEAELVQEMQQYFVQAKGHAGGIRFDNAGLWSKIEKRVGVWFAEVPRTRAGMPRTLSSSETSPGLLETLITC